MRTRPDGFISANDQIRVTKTLRDEKEKDAGPQIASTSVYRPDVRLQVTDAATVAVLPRIEGSVCCIPMPDLYESHRIRAGI